MKRGRNPAGCAVKLCQQALFFIFALTIFAAPGVTQTEEEHSVQIVSAEDVGPFRPTEHPDLKQVAAKIVAQTNALRTEQGLSELKVDPRLRQTAQDFASYMADSNRYGHTADGRRPSQRVKDHSYNFCIVSENIAFHFFTQGLATQALADRTARGWKNSPGHRRNMLKPYVTEIGVAVSQSDSTGVYYAVQMFGRPRSAALEFQILNRTETTVQYSIGDQTFSLPPSYRRTHQQCRPDTLRLKQQDQVLAEHQIRNGDALTVTAKDGTLQLQSVPQPQRRP